MTRPPPATDTVISDIAEYVHRNDAIRANALDTAHLCLIDSLGCGFEALSNRECMRHVGPTVAGTIVPNGARVPGTNYVLDPVTATFSIGTLIRWVDYSDSFFAETVIHPSDTLAGILATADWLSRKRIAEGGVPLLVRDVLVAAVQAYEIMGWLALDNDFLHTGLDNTFLGKIAVAAVCTQLLGGSTTQIENAITNAFIDGHPLATFRRAPNTGARKSWAGADAASRGVWLALMAADGEMGYATALTAKEYGFYDVLFGGKSFVFSQPLESYIIENVLFKIAFPAALHAQTAVEAAIILHPQVRDRLDQITRVELWTHQTCIIMIDKSGPLRNFADRDHCLQYMVAIGLIFGKLTGHDYDDEVAADPRIDALRTKMIVDEDAQYTRDYLAPDKRSNTNAIRVHFADGTQTGRVEVAYPLGHRARRTEGLPLLLEKFERNVDLAFTAGRRDRIVKTCGDRRQLETMTVNDFMGLLAGGI